MWPFRDKKPTLSLEEYAETRPTAPCGSQKEHVYWTEIEGWSCPVCFKIKERKRKELEENRMADKIAEAIIRKGGLR